eukprot:2369117-Ditylum_brightwellii.AAC.1
MDFIDDYPINWQICEAYDHIPINQQKALCKFNQLQREEFQYQDYLSNHHLKRAWTNLELYNFDTQLEKVIEEHNDQDQFKLPETVVDHINSFI